ncbi:hypothetical protein FNF28_03816 [Cafeteria roenbergensis]|uniref:AAA+ ATPase domain-containing protein n=1 Tax=Cafeteria roenbergensis TaxID=33653 RepID=A0A5A8DIW0_CAFRO|nr:hypothetical protein FNF28_03816 [Cafeteria roenbergensis]
MRLGHVLAVAAALLVICAPLLEAGAAQVRQADHEGAGPGYIEAETISVADGADPEPDDSADVTPGEDSAASGHRSRASRAQNALKRRVALMSSENRRLGELLAAAQSELESLQPTAMEAKRLVVAKAEAERNKAQADAAEAARSLELARLAHAEEVRASALANATVARDRAKADAEAAKRADAETRLAASRAEAARAEAARLESKRAVADAEARAAEAKALSASAESAAETRRADLLRSIVQEAASGAAGDMASNSSFVEALAGRLETISASLPDGSDPAAAARARKAASDAFQAEAVKLAAEHHVGTAEELAGGAEASLALNRTLEEALPRLGAAVADRVEEAKERTALAEASAAEARGEQDRQTERLRAELNRNTSLEAAREADRLARARDEERLRLEVAAAQAKEEARLAAELKIAEAAAGGEAAAAKARAEVEAAARIQQERDNEDVHERRRLKDAAAERERWLAVASASFDAIGDAGRAMVGPYLPQTVLAVLCVALAVYGSREALTLAGKAAALSLGKPRLVRETSLGSQPALDALDAVADAVTLGLTAWLAPEGVTAGLRASGPANPAAAFEGVVGRLGEELRESVIGLARSTRNAKSNHAPLRHALFYGPPGTGKTMAAQRLARSVGLDYAVMAGGDVAPLAAEAVTEIHRLFEWAKRSRRGLLLFIDEAEAFLGARDRAGGVSEHLRNVLSALLYQTGEQSSHYMMVLCTNRPEDLDAAVTDRVDQSLRFPLPEQQQRRAMVWQYFRSHVLARTAAEDAKRLADEAASVSAAGRQANGHSRPAGAANGKRSVAAAAVAPAPAPAPASAAADAPATPSRGCCAGRQPPQIRLHSDISASVIESLKVATAGFSGRQIGKLMLNVQGAVYAAEDVTLRRAMLDAVLSLEQRKHANKSRAEEAARAEAEATGRHTAFLGSWD